MQKIDIAQQVQRLLDSELTAYRIGKDTGLSITAVQRLKTGESAIDNLSVKTAQTLIDYACKELGC
ncbi:hypothetical protein C5Z26_08300 [Lactobacillus sp. CBA3606]|uniref:hypothetical protein n=1 Tax=Lactobacillus sp. CBA3606 TaxID=2099789 RepID=UPI000CFC56F7|nr:hypothetical protein [Lactobacillus sp. CBA3606]AVK64111.1 hypothetical protein C5Z26_08300 [Lactobacillus sp. CBA3606]